MIVIADSGSTKTQWLFYDKNKPEIRIETSGINPFYQTLQQIITSLQNEFLFTNEQMTKVKDVFFYGAGCAFDEQKKILKKALSVVFTQANIEVASDLLAAARAICQHNPGLVGILGTGSNSCYYNGNICAKQVPPLGYVLGDEGSGAVLGLHLVADFFKKQMPAELCEAFAERYSLTQADALEHVYKQPFPNRYLAGFVPFLSEHISEVYCYNLVFDCFVIFFERNIKQYDYRNFSVGFVGSVAWFFRDVLEVAAYESGLQISTIMRNPMDGLVDFHAKK